jgi:hypothetical protein
MTRRPESTWMVHGWHTAVGSVASGYAKQVGSQAAKKRGRVVDEGVAEADVALNEQPKIRRGCLHSLLCGKPCPATKA